MERETYIYYLLRYLEEYFDKKDCVLLINVRDNEEKKGGRNISYFEYFKGSAYDIFMTLQDKYHLNYGVSIIFFKANNEYINIIDSVLNDHTPYSEFFPEYVKLKNKNKNICSKCINNNKNYY